MRDMPAIVAFSHLRWDFVYQRPQHLLSRFAASRPVIFIEEPIHEADATPALQLSRPLPNVLVCRLITPVPAPGFHDDHLEAFRPLLRQLLDAEGLQEHMAWLYTPLALPLAQSFDPRLVVYDCMDELSAFLHAPPILREREAQLLKWADLVFTGGRSLYRAKRDRHPNVHCFPSSVDAAHFRAARGDVDEAGDQSALPRPRLGFYGVIDERIDVDLLAALAESHPEWQLVMVGPVVKIDPESLPRLPNIHYFGQRSYAELPSYLRGWDMCLLPFALNDATRYISPTKTLEYMAAELPIVSTPIADVVEPYGGIVYIGGTPQQFIVACEKALGAPASERARRVAGMRAVLAQTSWDATVQAMDHLIAQAVLARTAQQAT